MGLKEKNKRAIGQVQPKISLHEANFWQKVGVAAPDITTFVFAFKEEA